MPQRVIREELLTSEAYWNVCDEAKILFVHLLLCADDTARYTGNNWSLRARCFSGRSMEANRMEVLLSELADQDLVRLYDSAGVRFIFIPRFQQRLRYPKSKFPAPPAGISDLPIEKSNQASQQYDEKEGVATSSKEFKTPASTQSKGTRFSVEEEIGEEWIAYCKSKRPDLHPHDVFEVFKNYWAGTAGSKGLKADWFATWRNWVIKQDASRSKAASSGSMASGYANI
ncbi:hypothetical protein [Polynucleobacter sp. UK-Gri1-W3]|uniref:hypothetical protein n=1 Tax=Polynucleobacter sp. UK-Gri1-W3 TaxID=1819737 RepID=UPI001C0D9947|nr:hypothetical protein [Polynucleobacter sp. UK-Gri1-W3]MBU3539048.1 hypothetical protein [Polynucleobacter sp. UK-Gri1-W3]